MRDQPVVATAMGEEEGLPSSSSSTLLISWDDHVAEVVKAKRAFAEVLAKQEQVFISQLRLRQQPLSEQHQQLQEEEEEEQEEEEEEGDNGSISKFSTSVAAAPSVVVGRGRGKGSLGGASTDAAGGGGEEPPSSSSASQLAAQQTPSPTTPTAAPTGGGGGRGPGEAQQRPPLPHPPTSSTVIASSLPATTTSIKPSITTGEGRDVHVSADNRSVVDDDRLKRQEGEEEEEERKQQQTQHQHTSISTASQSSASSISAPPLPPIAQPSSSLQSPEQWQEQALTSSSYQQYPSPHTSKQQEGRQLQKEPPTSPLSSSTSDPQPQLKPKLSTTQLMAMRMGAQNAAKEIKDLKDRIVEVRGAISLQKASVATAARAATTNTGSTNGNATDELGGGRRQSTLLTQQQSGSISHPPPPPTSSSAKTTKSLRKGRGPSAVIIPKRKIPPLTTKNKAWFFDEEEDQEDANPSSSSSGRQGGGKGTESKPNNNKRRGEEILRLSAAVGEATEQMHSEMSEFANPNDVESLKLMVEQAEGIKQEMRAEQHDFNFLMEALGKAAARETREAEMCVVKVKNRLAQLQSKYTATVEEFAHEFKKEYEEEDQDHHHRPHRLCSAGSSSSSSASSSDSEIMDGDGDDVGNNQSAVLLDGSSSFLLKGGISPTHGGGVKEAGVQVLPAMLLATTAASSPRDDRVSGNNSNKRVDGGSNRRPPSPSPKEDGEANRSASPPLSTGSDGKGRASPHRHRKNPSPTSPTSRRSPPPLRSSSPPPSSPRAYSGGGYTSLAAAQSAAQSSAADDQEFIHNIAMRERLLKSSVANLERFCTKLEECDVVFENEMVCPQCEMRSAESYSLWPCGHMFCLDCIEEHLHFPGEGAGNNGAIGYLCSICGMVSQEMPVPNTVVNKVASRASFKHSGFRDLADVLQLFAAEIASVEHRFTSTVSHNYYRSAVTDPMDEFTPTFDSAVTGSAILAAVEAVM